MRENDLLAPTLSADQRRQIDELLDELLDLPEKSRLSALHRRRIDDSAVLSEVESLLAAAADSRDFLSTPANLGAEQPHYELELGARLGRWRIERLLGQGGMGDVYEGTRAEGDFEQHVAIKILRHEASGQMERFSAERQILARLEHPGIARLYDGGVTGDGRPYMVMEFVRGIPITDYCRQKSLDCEQRLQIFVKVCDAVAYAHRNLVIHRDLKPSNILIGEQGEVKLLDFGIAKLIEEGDALVRTAFTPMTPLCASPEQLSGKPITTATDVYALGVLLFELMTDTHPWVSADMSMLLVMRTVLERPAPVVSRIAKSQPHAPSMTRNLRGDVDAIVAKALRLEPQHRYGSVEAMKLDVQRALRSEAIDARGGARLYFMTRLFLRHRWAVLALLAVFVSLTIGIGLAAWQASKARNERDIARLNAAREEAVRYNLTGMFRAAIADRNAVPTTAKDMIDASAHRVLKEYRGQPELAGRLVLTLADLYGALQDVAGTASLLDAYVADPISAADPASLAAARQMLAHVELSRGHIARAAMLLDQSASFWATAPDKYADERLEGLGTRALLQRLTGDIGGSIATSRAAIEQREALSGHNHRETANLYNSLAISLTAMNRIQEALAAYRETMRIYQAIGLGDVLDTQIIAANVGMLELRTGDLRAAETSLKQAIDGEQQLSGPSAALAAAMGNYGRLLVITDRIPEATRVLQAAEAMAIKYAGDGSPVLAMDMLILIDAQLAAGNTAAAKATLDMLHSPAFSHYDAMNPVALRITLAEAQVAVAMGRYGIARSNLSGLVDRLHAMGPRGSPYLAQALELLGEAQMQEGLTKQALASLNEAIVQLNGSSGAWEVAVARERLGEALAASGDRGSRPQLLRAAKVLETELGSNNAETRRANAALAQLEPPKL